MIQRIFLLFLFLMKIPALSNAQERSFGTLPMAQKPGASLQRGARIEDTPEYKRALAVYERLVSARGDYRYPVPTFLLSGNEAQVAFIDYKKLEIGLEKRAYEVCAGFGPDTAAVNAAIAFLLGHELTHYYEKHAWRRGFAADYKDLKIGIRLDSLTDAVANETEADYLGGFLAYSAGFGLFEKGAELIGRLYKAYGLDKLTPGELAELEKVYPSLSDRQALGVRSAEKLVSLVEVFDMANLLTAIGKYAQAYEYYRYILMEYQSREIYNNLGVATVLDVINQYFNESELKFRFPLELDLESSGSKGDGMVTRRNQLLQQAILHFDAAISLDPNYAPAYLNKATAYALMGDNVRARFYADLEAREAAQKGKYPKTANDTDILIGIIDWREGKAVKAEAAFQAAAAKGSALAAYNLSILRNETIEPEAPPSIGIRPERIDEQTIAQISDDPRIDRKKDVAISERIQFRQNPLQGARSRLFVSQNTQTDDLVFLHMTNPGYTGKTARGIGLGDNRAAIVGQYGEPSRTVETPRGQIMVYKRIIFILGANGSLERWANYF